MVFLIALTGSMAAFLLFVSVSGWLRFAIADARRQIAPNTTDSWCLYVDFILADFNERPARKAYATELHTQLIHAARANRFTGRQYLALMEAASASSGGLVLLLGLAGHFSLIGTLVFAALVAAAVWWFMSAQLTSWTAARRRSISREFPYFLDLAVLMMGAGANFSDVLQGYVGIAGKSALALDMNALASETSMGTSTDAALATLETRIPSADVTSVIRSIRQGIRMGIPISVTFRDQAEAMRFRRSQRAERDSEELKVKLQGPTMLLMIAILLLVLGPALVSMGQSGM
jgi:tight adherence protein C